MKKKLFLSIFILILFGACSKDNASSSKEIPQEQNQIKKIRQITENGKTLNTFHWQDDKLLKVDYYKNGILDSYKKITYEGNTMAFDSIFDSKDHFIRRNVYIYNSFGNLISSKHYRVGYAYQKRNLLETKFNNGTITQSEYYISAQKLTDFYSPAMKKRVSNISYPKGSQEYNSALIEIEKTGDALYSEVKYAYDTQNFISDKITIIDGVENNRQVYVYSENRHKLIITTTLSLGNQYRYSYVFDGKIGVHYATNPNKADWFFNSLERKVIENPDNIKLSDYTGNYTYDSQGYPLTGVITYSDGVILDQKYVWE